MKSIYIDVYLFVIAMKDGRSYDQKMELISLDQADPIERPVPQCMMDSLADMRNSIAEDVRTATQRLLSDALIFTGVEDTGL